MSDFTKDPEALKQWVCREAEALGFELCKITGPDSIPQAGEQLAEFIDDHRHGSMTWLADTYHRRHNPKNLWSETRSIIMLAMNYTPGHDPLEILQQRHKGAISVYAQNRDYHDVVKGKLKILAGKLARRGGCDVKVFVDTAPVMEKPLAQAAGLGWQGKHSNLLSRQLGSWFFLGSIFTTARLPRDQPESQHCGSCRACLDVCPTDAFVAPYQLDARRCISYLTIESKAPIPLEFRRAMGNRIFGCDDCLAVCPWNKFAQVASEAKLVARDDIKAPDLAFLAGLDDRQFRRFFSANPVKRIGRNRFLRNVLIAIGNSGMAELLPHVMPHLADNNSLVRGAAIWALAQLDVERARALAVASVTGEKEAEVRKEWELVIQHQGHQA